MGSEDLLEQLRTLEVELHQPEVRSSVQRLDELLHESFTEIGRSGEHYDRNDILDQLPREESTSSIWSGSFSVDEILPGLALVTYESAQLDTNGMKSRRTMRSSLWQQTSKGWQIRFHQGTAAADVADCAT